MSGRRRILLIDGHPDGESRRFGHALASAYAVAAEGASHEVHVSRLADIEDPLLTSQQSWMSGRESQIARGSLAGHRLGRSPRHYLSALAG